MNQENFKDTVSKKLNLDYSKGVLEADKDILSLCTAMEACGIEIDFTDKPAEAGTREAVIHLKIPMEDQALFEKYNQTIVDMAKDLYGSHDGYMIGGLVCDVVVAEEAKAV